MLPVSPGSTSVNRNRDPSVTRYDPAKRCARDMTLPRACGRAHPRARPTSTVVAAVRRLTRHCTGVLDDDFMRVEKTRDLDAPLPPHPPPPPHTAPPPPP